MTVAVAYKDGDKVWVGADSCVSNGHSKKTFNNKSNIKIIIPPKEKETIISFTGHAKLANVLGIQDRFIDELTYLKNEFDYKYMVTTVVPNIFGLLRQYGLVNKDKDNDNNETFFGSLIFAHKDKLFKVSGDGFVMEIEDYVAIGSGELHSTGHLNCSSYTDKKEAVVNSLRSAIVSARGVGYPIVVSNTLADSEIEIIEE